MSGKVVRDNEVELNSIRYPLAGDGQIHPILSSQLAPKQVIGDYGLDSDPDKSYWSLADGSGGIGVEELLASSQANRSYFTTCNTKYPRHLFLNSFTSSIALPGNLVIVNADMELNSNWTTESGTGAQAAFPQAGTYSWKLGNVGGTSLVYQDISVTISIVQGATITISGYVAKDNTDGDAYIGIDDGVGTTWSSAVTKDGDWHLLSVTKKLSASATRLRVYMKCTAVTDVSLHSAHFDTFTSPIFTIGTANKFCEFNGALYLAAGTSLLKLNVTGDGFVYIANLPQTITDLNSSVNNCLYIGQGGSVYYYMNTSEVFTATNVADMNLAIHWDNKLNKITSLGQMSYAATPNSATPSWTNKGLIDTASLGTINSLITYTDASGADTIYAATTKGLLAHDYTNALWLNTQLQLPKHTDNGKGVVVQNGNLHYSAGLSVYEYSLNGGALSIKNVGLDKDDGLPDEYVGSISKLFAGFEGDFYALVDASLISASNYSSVVKYDGSGWHPIWVDTIANEPMYSGIVSSVYAYRLWFGVDSKVNWIPLDRAKRNPLKTTTNYAAAGIYYSPRFDAGWAVGNKIASKIRVLAQSTTADETVVIKYRVNVLPNTALTSSWTTLGTLTLADANVEKVYSLASGVGITFKNIQFALDLVRGSTMTKTPDVRYLTLEYERFVPIRWGYQMTLDCTKEYDGKSGEQLLDALVTAAETETLITLIYKTTTKYVRIKSVRGEQLTGNNRKGTYTVLAVEK